MDVVSILLLKRNVSVEIICLHKKDIYVETTIHSLPVGFRSPTSASLFFEFHARISLTVAGGAARFLGSVVLVFLAFMTSLLT